MVLSDEIVWLLYYQAVLWLNLILFPSLAFVTPFFLYIMFKFLYWRLRHLVTKPRQSSKASDTGFFIMLYLNITFILVVATIAGFLTLKMTHQNWNTSNQCGPFTTETAAITPLSTDM